MKVKSEKLEEEERRGIRMRERMISKTAKITSAAQTNICREIRLARTIPARNAMENHTNGSFVDNPPWIRIIVEGFSVCIVDFHDSIELNG